MPTLISHPAIPIALAIAGGRRKVSLRLLLMGIVASVLPDIDTIGLYLGIPYSHILGHRGFFHSILFAFLIALFGILVAPYQSVSIISGIIFWVRVVGKSYVQN